MHPYTSNQHRLITIFHKFIDLELVHYRTTKTKNIPVQHLFMAYTTGPV